MTDKEKLQFLTDKISVMTNTVDNQSPSMLLWELRRVAEVIESWETEEQSQE